MDKALIEKAFKFWWSSRYLNSQHIRQAKNAFIAGATWQREQLDKYKAKDLLDEIHTNYMCYHAKNYDTKDFVINLASGSVVVMDKQGYQNLQAEREQLEAEKNKLIKDTEVCRKATNGTDDYSVGMRNGMEVILCTLEKREPRMDNCLPRTNNLSEREQIIKELREWIESNKELRGYTGIPDDTLNIILAKLDLLEKGGE